LADRGPPSARRRARRRPHAVRAAGRGRVQGALPVPRLDGLARQLR
jgi:hypothetical protein